MLYLTDENINRILDWNSLVSVIETAFKEISELGDESVPPRNILTATKIPLTFYAMPSFSYSQGIASCKLVTQCPENSKRYGLPSITGIVAIFNLHDGQLRAILDASVLTAWRTAAGSLVATNYLYAPVSERYAYKTLAVLGAGVQAKTHIIAFYEFFNIKNINLWNHHQHKADALANDLQLQNEILVNVFADAKECVGHADIVIWAASAAHAKYVSKSDLKHGAFVISVTTVSGLADDIFQNAQLFTESLTSAQMEMKEFIEKNNLEFTEVGEIILGRKSVEDKHGGFVVYQSLGSAMMDTAAGKLVVDNYENKLKEKQ